MLKMNKTLMIGMAVLAMTGFAGAAIVDIDTFDNGTLDDSISTYTSSTDAEDVAGVIGTTRRITVEALGSGGSGTVDYNVDGGSNIIGLGTNTTSSAWTGEWTLQYGYTAAGAADDLAVDLEDSTNTAFRLDFTSCDHDYDIAITVTDNDSSDTVTQNDLAGNLNPHSVYFDFSSFTGIDFTDVDQIDIVFTGREDGDYDMSYALATTPEPGTAALLTIGAFGLLLRRHRRRRVVTA